MVEEELTPPENKRFLLFSGVLVTSGLFEWILLLIHLTYVNYVILTYVTYKTLQCDNGMTMVFDCISFM